MNNNDIINNMNQYTLLMNTYEAVTVYIENLSQYKLFYIIATHGVTLTTYLISEYIPVPYMAIGLSLVLSNNYDGYTRSIIFSRRDQYRIAVSDIYNIGNIKIYGVK